LEGYLEIGNYLAKHTNLENSILVYFDGAKYTIASKKYNVKEFIKKLVEHYGGKGGGKEDFGNYQNQRKLTNKELLSILKLM
ncbi:MAG: alanyl-tRNA editing protein, partial [Fervidobacterium sp.]